jgi:hypothetical protein
MGTEALLIVCGLLLLGIAGWLFFRYLDDG